MEKTKMLRYILWLLQGTMTLLVIRELGSLVFAVNLLVS